MDAASLDPRLREAAAANSNASASANANASPTSTTSPTATARGGGVISSPDAARASSQKQFPANLLTPNAGGGGGQQHQNQHQHQHQHLHQHHNPPGQASGSRPASSSVTQPTIPPLHHSPGPYAVPIGPFSPDTNSSAAPTPTTSNGGSYSQGATARPGSPGGGPADPNHPDSKKPRACESCRQLKVKCEAEAENPDGPCRRCAKAGRACVVTQPTRKRQKKTDSRVAELEKKIDMLTASLHQHGSTGLASAKSSVSAPNRATMASPTVGAPIGGLAQSLRQEDNSSPAGGLSSILNSREWGGPAPGLERTAVPPTAQSTSRPPQGGGFGGADLDNKAYPPPMMAMAGQKRKFADTRDNTPVSDMRDQQDASMSSRQIECLDVVDRGIITMTLAAELFARYTDRMCQHLPGVVFPPGTSVHEVRRSKPTLFLSIMTAASSELPAVQRVLNKELMQIIAEKTIVQGQKSLELVQALQLTVIWYWPPEHYEELKFYSLVHIAAVMAIDMGLGRKTQNPGGFRKHIPLTWRDHPFRKRPPPDPTTIEARRTWLTCYFLSTNTSIALHRPNLIRWSSFMTECLEVLETSPDAAPSDRYLCHLVWTHKLAEEVGIQFSIDDPSAALNVLDQQTQYALRGFERRLAKYRAGVPPEDQYPALQLAFHTLNLYMHEIATQPEFLDIPDQEEDSAPVSPGVTLTPAHINAISACLTAIDGIFEVFLTMDVVDIRCLPVFNFVRVAYAVVILIKMYFAASSNKSELGKVIDKDNMKVEQHVETLLEKFRATAADDKSRPAAKFMVVLAMLRSWFQKQKHSGGPGNATPAGGSGKDTPFPYLNREPSRSPYPPRKDDPLPRPLPPPTAYPSTANTPLQVLSEIAANDSVANASASPRDVPTGPPWLLRPNASQPFMYDNPENTPGSNAASTDPTNLPGVSGAAGSAIGPPIGTHQVIPPVMPWLNGTWNGDFDYTTLGDNFVQAMDLTLADLTDGGFSASFENSMRILMQDSPFFPSGSGNIFDVTGTGQGGAGGPPGGFY